MKEEQFLALAQLIRLRQGKSREAARLALVDGMSHKDVVKKTGMTYQGVGSVVRRCNNALGLAKLAVDS